ncbi:MAG: hypothetical protein ACJ75J_16925, partial [Cytophagaceae bacterium]
ILFISVLCMLAAVTVFLWMYSYDDFTVLLANSAGVPERVAQFRNSLLTPEKFQILRISFSIITFIYAVLIIFVRLSSISLFLEEAAKDGRLVFQNIGKEILSLSLYERMIAGVIFFAVIIFHLLYFFNFPIFVDEAFTYVYFVSKGFLTSASYYPGPNNHVFYSELCVLTDLFTDNSFLILRLPSFLFSVILMVLFFFVVRKYTEFYTAGLSTVLFSLSEQVNFYSGQGRGYVLLLLLVLISMYSLGQVLFHDRKFYFLLFIKAAFLGFYTMPIFLYPFSSMVVWSLLVVLKKQNPELFFKLVIAGVSIGTMVFILYLPVLILNPWNVIFHNGWVSAKSDFADQIFLYLYRLNEFWWGNRYGFCFSIASLVGLFLLVYHKKTFLFSGLLCFLLVPCLLVAVQRVLPFERVWLYFLPLLCIGFSYLLLFIFRYLMPKPSGQPMLGAALIFSGLIFFSFLNIDILTKKTFSYYREAAQLFSMCDSMNARNILVSEPDYNTLLRFYALKDKKRSGFNRPGRRGRNMICWFCLWVRSLHLRIHW